MSAWRKYMKPIAICGGALALAILAAIALTAGGCQARLFSKKGARRPVPAAKTVPASEVQPEQSIHRRELDELLSIE